MARIQAQALSPNHQVWVGWDSPLETFFGQVYDLTRDEDEQIIHWVGLQVGEISTVEALREVMEPYCIFSDRIATELHADCLNRTVPSPLQKWGRSL